MASIDTGDGIPGYDPADDMQDDDTADNLFESEDFVRPQSNMSGHREGDWPATPRPDLTYERGYGPGQGMTLQQRLERARTAPNDDRRATPTPRVPNNARPGGAGRQGGGLRAGVRTGNNAGGNSGNNAGGRTGSNAGGNTAAGGRTDGNTGSDSSSTHEMTAMLREVVPVISPSLCRRSPPSKNAWKRKRQPKNSCKRASPSRRTT